MEQFLEFSPLKNISLVEAPLLRLRGGGGGGGHGGGGRGVGDKVLKRTPLSRPALASDGLPLSDAMVARGVDYTGGGPEFRRFPEYVSGSGMPIQQSGRVGFPPETLLRMLHDEDPNPNPNPKP